MSDAKVFDALALSYDADFTHSIIGQMLRDDVRAIMADVWQAGDKVLEIGCGTGEDGLWLMGRGVRVCATDASAEMLAIARAKLGADGDVRVFNLNELPNTWHEGAYDGVLSNFGGLNCADDLRSVAGWLAHHTQVGARLVLIIMGRYCLWEALWYGLHGDWQTAKRRWRGQWHFTSESDEAGITIHYPTVKEVKCAFTGFEVEQVIPLGLALPPTAIYGVIEKRPRWLAGLRQVELWAQKRAFLADLSDHYVIVLKKSDS